MNSPSLDKLRAMFAQQGQINAEDDAGNVYTGKEAAAYYEGRDKAGRATELLKRAGVIPPALEGMYENQDTKFRTALQDIAHSVHIEPSIVYNPGCGTHVTLATAFPEARAIFTDLNKEAIGDVQAAGYEAYGADMHEFELPDGVKADITLILNAGYMTQEELDRVVADDGVVVVNNWHGAYDHMKESCPGYTLREDIETAESVWPNASLNDTNALFVFQRQAAE